MTDCAILAIAATTQTICALLEKLVKDVVLDDHTSVVPWTIVNKYYTAEIKFVVHTLSSIQDQLSAPALLFVWNRGEPYRDYIRELTRHAPQHEFEVALAVRLPPTDPTLPAEVEDDQNVDAYLSSNGFEFIDVRDSETCSPDRSGIPGIPRIIDALSTIMWPSMVRHTFKRLAATGFIGASPTNPDDYHNLVRLVGERIFGNDGDRMQRELEELDRWLDQDALSGDADVRCASGDDEAIPWSTVVTPGALSPTTPKAGFDDDFTSFVSASSPNSAGIHRPLSQSLSPPQKSPSMASMSFSSTFSFSSTSSGRSTPTVDDRDTTRLASGESYKSLGSASDFGDPDEDSIDVKVLSDNADETDEDMPSRAEIAETSRRIFGTIPLSLSPVQERGAHNLTALGDALPQGYLRQGLDVEMTDADLERFDLQSVLSALQRLKEEIAGMPDKERRRTAARVALGLAYGLHSPHSERGDELV